MFSPGYQIHFNYSTIPEVFSIIYFSNSTIAGADEGLFAKRDFQPGDLISYYGGKRFELTVMNSKIDCL